MEHVDVVVVGAGLAGLVTAAEVKNAGHSVAVVEAQNRVGGRVLSIDADGQWFELGGRWTGPGQTQIKCLASALGMATFSPVASGDFVEVSRGRRSVSSLRRGRVSVGGDLPLEEALPTIRELDRLAWTVPLHAPWETENAKALDAITMADWLRSRRSQTVALALERILEGFLPEAHEVSLLHALFYLHSNGGLAAILGLDGPAHDSELFQGGAQLIANKLAERLGPSVRLSTPVSRLVTRGESVQVSTADGVIQAKYVVVAVPPALAARIHYDPPMSAARDYLIQRTPIRGKIAVALLYERPFWQGDGLSGLARHDILFAWDAGSDQASGRIGALLTIEASRRLAEVSPEERRREVQQALAECLGSSAAQPRSYLEKQWADDPWCRGCNSFTTTGAWTAYGRAWRSPAGRIHWAGAELSSEFVGQMEGAVRSGQKAASDVLGRLS